MPIASTTSKRRRRLGISILTEDALYHQKDAMEARKAVNPSGLKARVFFVFFNSSLHQLQPEVLRCTGGTAVTHQTEE